MIHTLTENQYLNTLVESKQIQNRRKFVMDIDFSTNELYSGDETLGEMFLNEDITGNFLEESVMAMPISKMKAIVADIGKNISSKDGLGKIHSKYGRMAKSVPPEKIKDQAMHLAAVKGIDPKHLNNWFEQIVRMMGVAGLAMTLPETPLGWALILIFLIQSNDLKDFGDNVRKFLIEISKAVKGKDSEYEKAMIWISLGYKFMLACFIPPFIQSIVLAPMAGIYIVVGEIILICNVYMHLGKK